MSPTTEVQHSGGADILFISISIWRRYAYHSYV